ncbi:hypothetical protein ACHAXT_004865 [Thalassiosira profunda]
MKAHSSAGALLCCCCALAPLPGAVSFHSALPTTPRTVSSAASALGAFQWPTLPSLPSPIATANRDAVGERNGLDDEYPWRFEGRFLFRPSLVRTSDARPPSASLLSLFGYSLGGSVVLEYDVSPVGPYREYVEMGGVVGLGRVNVGGDGTAEKKQILGIGQWGTDLFVSTQVAEDVCRVVWGVPAQVADIEFIEGGDVLADGVNEDSPDEGRRRKFAIAGWKNTRILNSGEPSKRYGGIPIYWTPTIKALWAPLLFPGGGKGSGKNLLPLHKLRLSAGALRLKKCERIKSEGEVPLGLALVVDDVLIEIGERVADKEAQ